MPSEKFRINTNGQSLRNPSNGFFGMTLSPNLTVDESDASAHNDRRSAHNALERQRREHLNVKFQQLAHALPSLQTVRRPSKTMIVAKSLEFVSSSLKRESNYTSEIRKLREENERLKKQAQAAAQSLINENDFKVKDEPSPLGEKPSLKRKSTEAELSPPLTPIMHGNKPKTKQTSPIHPKKKRMVEQTKSNTDFTAPLMVPFIETSMNYPPHYFDIPSYNQPLLQHMNLNEEQQRIMPGSTFQSMMNPMLLAPYYVPSETPTHSVYSYIQDHHQRQTSDDSFF